MAHGSSYIKGKVGKLMKGKDTLCWKCNKTCGKCSWTKNFKPVKGWTAVKTKFFNGNTYEQSYLVTKCPEFEKFKTNDLNDIRKEEIYFLYLKFNHFLSEEEIKMLEVYFTQFSKGAYKQFNLSFRSYMRKITKIKKHLYYLNSIYNEEF